MTYVLCGLGAAAIIVGSVAGLAYVTGLAFVNGTNESRKPKRREY